MRPGAVSNFIFQPPRRQDSEVYISIKHGHTTTFLLTTPLTPFHTIITDLLSGLSARYPDGIPSGPQVSAPTLTIPTNPEQVRLAKLHDNTNSDKGWSEIPWLKYEHDKTKNCPRAWDIQGGAKLAFTFTKDDVEVGRLREHTGEVEEEMIGLESPDFWVEWPNYEWMDQEAEGDEDDTAKRLRDEGEDGDEPVREKRRRVVDDDEEVMDEPLNEKNVAALAPGYRR